MERLITMKKITPKHKSAVILIKTVRNEKHERQIKTA